MTTTEQKLKLAEAVMRQANTRAETVRAMNEVQHLRRILIAETTPADGYESHSYNAQGRRVSVFVPSS